ncbi:hypothetical protein [Brevundimonas subvibrioides]|uniref:hypothetical protein n=1 Tax=Brevundimonas subvibrioides TaxID=74313 RepID=UPI0022B58174|nr:hypothetical protein [Brevundimonas subvibrioides]
MLFALLTATTAFAQDTEPFAPDGVWIFRTDELANGSPVCTEAWEFGPGGRLSVESGEEKVDKRFRIVRDTDGLWLVTKTLHTNGRPDCVGNETAIADPVERRIYIVPMNDGRVLTCPAPGRAPDGAPFITGCYGSILPADRVG